MEIRRWNSEVKFPLLVSIIGGRNVGSSHFIKNFLTVNKTSLEDFDLVVFSQHLDTKEIFKNLVDEKCISGDIEEEFLEKTLTRPKDARKLLIILEKSDDYNARLYHSEAWQRLICIHRFLNVSIIINISTEVFGDTDVTFPRDRLCRRKTRIFINNIHLQSDFTIYYHLPPMVLKQIQNGDLFSKLFMAVTKKSFTALVQEHGRRREVYYWFKADDPKSIT